MKDFKLNFVKKKIKIQENIVFEVFLFQNYQDFILSAFKEKKDKKEVFIEDFYLEELIELCSEYLKKIWQNYEYPYKIFVNGTKMFSEICLKAFVETCIFNYGKDIDLNEKYKNRIIKIDNYKDYIDNGDYLCK